MIIRLPGLPPLTKTGKAPRPIALLYGASSWQVRAARMLTSSARVVVCSDQCSGVDVTEWESVYAYFDIADVVIVWLDDLMFGGFFEIGHLAATHRDKMVIGLDQTILEDPINQYVRVQFYLHRFGIVYYTTLEQTLSAAKLKLRAGR